MPLVTYVRRGATAELVNETHRPGPAGRARPGDIVRPQLFEGDETRSVPVGLVIALVGDDLTVLWSPC